MDEHLFNNDSGYKLLDWRKRTARLRTGKDVNAGEAMNVMLSLLGHIYTFQFQNNEQFLLALRRAAEGKPVDVPPTINKECYEHYFQEKTGKIHPEAAKVILAATEWRQIDGREHFCLVSPFDDKEIEAEYRKLRIEQIKLQGADEEEIPTEPVDRGLPHPDLMRDAQAKDFETGETALLKSGQRVGRHSAIAVLGFLDSYLHDEDLRRDNTWEDELLSIWKLARGEKLTSRDSAQYMMDGFTNLDGEADPAVVAIVKAALRWNKKGDAVIVNPFADEHDAQAYHQDRRSLNERFGEQYFSHDDGTLMDSPPWLRRTERSDDEEQRR